MNKNNTDAFEVSIDGAFDFLSPEYAELFGNSAATAFQHPVWLDRLYNKLAPIAAAKPLVIVVRYRATGALAMVLPLLRVRRGPIRAVEFADLRVSDYLVPVCNANVFSDLLQDEQARRDIRRLVRPFDLLRMVKLPDGRLPIETLLGTPRRTSMDMNTYSTVLTAPFEQWRAGALDRPYQTELAKKMRQLQRKGALEFSCCDDRSSILGAFEVMKRLRGPRFEAQGDGDLLQRAEYFEFYSDVAIRGLGSLVRLYVMKMDGEVIAAVLGLPIGDEPYKKLFGAQPSPMWSATQAGSAAGSVALFALRQAPWIKQAAKKMAEFKLLQSRTSSPMH